MLHKEYPRYVLWIPVLLGLGIHLYFELSAEPSFLVLQVLIAITVVLLLAQYFLPSYRIFLYTLAFVCMGFSIAQFKAIIIAAPKITKSLPPTNISGVIKEVETTAYGYRFTLSVEAIDGLELQHTPKNVTLILRRKELPIVFVGNHLKARVKLVPLQGPLFPGGFGDHVFGYKGLDSKG